jgi:hydrogenase maturation protein HypF
LRDLERKYADRTADMIRKGVNSPKASSAGRLFDAVAAALDIHFDAISYEGQAAMELEALARRADRAGKSYAFGRIKTGGLPRLDPTPMWECLMRDLAAGISREIVAARFHAGLAEATANFALEIAEAAGIDRVVLSGGVLQNRTLATGIAAALARAGVERFQNAEVPPNDGGISLGQAAIAAVAAE